MTCFVFNIPGIVATVWKTCSLVYFEFALSLFMTARWKLRLHSKLHQAELLRMGKLKKGTARFVSDFEKRQFITV